MKSTLSDKALVKGGMQRNFFIFIFSLVAITVFDTAFIV